MIDSPIWKKRLQAVRDKDRDQKTEDNSQPKQPSVQSRFKEHSFHLQDFRQGFVHQWTSFWIKSTALVLYLYFIMSWSFQIIRIIVCIQEYLTSFFLPQVLCHFPLHVLGFRVSWGSMVFKHSPKKNPPISWQEASHQENKNEWYLVLEYRHLKEKTAEQTNTGLNVYSAFHHKTAR